MTFLDALIQKIFNCQLPAGCEKKESQEGGDCSRQTSLNFFAAALAAVLMVTLAACANVSGVARPTAVPEIKTVVPTIMVSATPAAETASPTAGSDQAHSDIEINTATPNPNEIVWSKDVPPVAVIEDEMRSETGTLWSPTENQLLLNNCQPSNSNLVVAAAPDFRPRVLSASSGCMQAGWSADGQKIAYIGEDDTLRIVELNDSGSDQHVTIGQFRVPMEFQWVDASHLVLGTYSGGGHMEYALVDIANGKNEEIAMIRGGDLDPYRFDYLPVTAEIEISDERLIVLSNRFSAAQGGLSTFAFLGHYRLFPTYQSVPVEQAWTASKGWLPGTTQLLVAWKQYKDFFDPEILQEALLFWDIATDQISVAAPNGTDGLLSPDGGHLAYLTRGPALLNQQNQPINNTESEIFSLYGPFPEVQTYLQLRNRLSGKITVSVPASEMNFSPDSTYFAYLTGPDVPPETVLDTDGTLKAEANRIYITGLEDEKLVLSIQQAASLPVWSPAENEFLYTDVNGAVILYKIDQGVSTEIVQLPPSVKINNMGWSQDGQYFSIMLYSEHDLTFESRTAIFTSPD
jgi:hypothetical protein